MGSVGCAEVTLVTLVALRGVVIGQNVATELQRVNNFKYSQLLKRRINLVELQVLKITCFGFISSVLESLSGFNFSLNLVTCFTAECFFSSVLLRFDAILKAGKFALGYI